MLVKGKLCLRGPRLSAAAGLGGRAANPRTGLQYAASTAWSSSRSGTGSRLGTHAVAVDTASRIKPAITERWTPSAESLHTSLSSASSLSQLQEVLSLHSRSLSDHHWLRALYRLPALAYEESEHNVMSQARKVLVAFEGNSPRVVASSGGDTIADILTVFAIFKHTPSAEFYQTTLHELLENSKAAGCSTDNFCNLVISLAKLQMACMKSWPRLLVLAQQHVEVMTGSQVVNVLLALTRINPVMRDGLSHHVLALTTMLATRARACLGLYNNSELATLCYALGSVNYRDSAVWEEVVDVAAKRVNNMQPAEVSKLARGLALAGQKAPKVFNAIADMVMMELSKPASAVPVSYDVQVLGEILGTFIRLNLAHVQLYAAIARHVASMTSGLGAAMLKSPELRRWITCIRKQQGDTFMYGFFLSLLFGVALDQMVGATVTFVTAWWVVLRPMLTEAAANAYADLLAKKQVWYGFWLQWIFSFDEAEDQQRGSSTLSAS